jgi:hypothetical protein
MGVPVQHRSFGSVLRRLDTVTDQKQYYIDVRLARLIAQIAFSLKNLFDRERCVEILAHTPYVP